MSNFSTYAMQHCAKTGDIDLVHFYYGVAKTGTLYILLYIIYYIVTVAGQDTSSYICFPLLVREHIKVSFLVCFGTLTR